MHLTTALISIFAITAMNAHANPMPALANPVCKQTPSVHCENRNEAWVTTCRRLLERLQSDPDRMVEENSDRRICEGADPDKCCVEWTQAARFPYRDLQYAMSQAETTCMINKDNFQLFSARTTWIALGNRCNTLCFSNGHSRCRD
jgi:hypothetical protein